MKFLSFVLSAALMVQQTNAKCKKNRATYDGSESGTDRGYFSTNDVTKQASIDLDVGEIADLFDAETDGNWTVAKGIYENGKNVEKDGEKLSIQSLSLDLDDLEDDDIPKLLEKYVAYFGTRTYGNEIVSAGFSKGSTQMTNGNIDLSPFEYEMDNVEYGFMGREEVSKKAMQYLITPMQMHVKMTEASNLIGVDNDAAALAWDTAVAYFTGTTFKDLVYTLANKRCGDFDTCTATVDNGKDGGDCAPANDEIFKQFKKGQKYISKGKKKRKMDQKIDKIIDAMLAPLMQGTLRYSYKIGMGGYSESGVSITNQMGQKERAEGYMFVVGALPYVHECSPIVAQQLYDLMKIPQEVFTVGQVVPNLDDDVKRLFAYVSSCTGVTCDDLGDMLDPFPTDINDVPVVSTCPYPRAPKHCKDNPLKEVERKGKEFNCAKLNDLNPNKREKHCKTKAVKKGCKYTCKNKCGCDDDDNPKCKKVIKLKKMKDVVDFCIENPSLQTECPSACQGWCKKYLKGGF